MLDGIWYGGMKVVHGMIQFHVGQMSFSLEMVVK
jgi:hypothetical protein